MIFSRQRSGSAEVIATFLLIASALGAAGTYQAFQSDMLNEFQEPEYPESFPLEIESCWYEDDQGTLAVRNTGENTVNVSNIDLSIDQVLVESFNIEPKIVESQQTFQITFDKEIDEEYDRIEEIQHPRLEVFSDGDSDVESCYGIDFTFNPDLVDVEYPEIIDEGDEFTLDFEIENLGSVEGEEDLELIIEGDIEDSSNIQMGPEDSVSGDLEWDTESGDAGSYSLKLNTSEETFYTGSLDVEAVPPVAQIDYSPEEPETDEDITLDGSNSEYELEEGTIEEYNWEIIDQENNEITKTRSGEENTISLNEEGYYTAELEIKTSSDKTDSDTDSFFVTDKILIADFEYAPSSPEEEDTVTFNDDSTTENTNVEDYEWDFDDGDTAEGEEVDHEFDSSGSYDVELKITDEDGDSDSETKEISVDPEFCELHNVDYSGSGTSSNPYEVSDAYELQCLKEDSDSYYEITDDIDASDSVTDDWFDGDGFNPIPGFEGELEGNNNEVEIYVEGVGIFNTIEEDGIVKNIDITGEIDGEDSLSFVGGLTGDLSGGEVYNVRNFADVKGEAVGGIAGNYQGFAGSGIIENSENHGNIASTIEGVDSRAGGIAAISQGTIRESTNTGMIRGSQMVGGIVGENMPGTFGNGMVSNTVNEGTIEGDDYIGGITGAYVVIVSSENYGNVEGDDYVGGIAGTQNEHGTDEGWVNYNENHGGVEASGDRIGGIVSEIQEGDLEENHNYADIDGGSRVGGIAGEIDTGDVAYESLENDGEVSGESNVGDIFGWED